MPSDPPGGYVHRVMEDTQRYARELLSENERLRQHLVAVDAEKERLGFDLAAARAELARRDEERARLLRQLDAAAEESRRFSDRYTTVEQENANLANLYVASYRLHGSVDRREVLQVLQEILANLVGSEETAIFEIDSDGTALRLLESIGISSERYRRVPLGSGTIGRAAQTGERFVIGPGTPPGEEPGLTACIPLKLEGRVVGAIAIFRLLPQKSTFHSLDIELFELLGTHAATALYASGLHERVSAGVRA